MVKVDFVTPITPVLKEVYFWVISVILCFAVLELTNLHESTRYPDLINNDGK